MAGVAHGEENTVERLFRNHHAFVPPNDLRRAVAPLIAALVCPMALAIVVVDPFLMNALHFLPTPGLMEMKVSHSSDDIDSVEYSRCLLKTLQEEGARSPHNASYLGIFPIPNNIQHGFNVG
jgi:hypothetical protein